MRKKRTDTPDRKIEVISEDFDSGEFDFLDGVTQPSVRLERERDLRLEKPRPGVGAVGGSEKGMELRQVEAAPFGEPGQRVLIGVCFPVREVEPERDVGRRAVGAAGGESDVDGAEAPGNVDGPAEEDVGDDAEGRPASLFDDAAEEAPARRFEASRGVEQLDDLGEREVLGVLDVGGETVVGAREGKLNEVDVGGGGDGGTEVVDVELSGGDEDGEGGGAVDLVGQCEERDKVAVSHERQHDDVLAAAAMRLRTHLRLSLDCFVFLPGRVKKQIEKTDKKRRWSEMVHSK